jgi:hypothetical protein
VLPFQNMSGDPEQEYFADGMVEEIITALSRFKSLFVIARNSSFTFKGRGPGLFVARRSAVAVIKAEADRHAANVVPITREVQPAGAETLRDVAAALNARGIVTARGGKWHATSVKTCWIGL